MKYSIMTILALTFSASILAEDSTVASAQAPAQVELQVVTSDDVALGGSTATPSTTQAVINDNQSAQTATNQPRTNPNRGNAARANQSAATQNDDGQNLPAQGTPWAQTCTALYEMARKDPNQQAHNDYKACKSTMELASSLGNEQNLFSQQSYKTVDGRVTCKKLSGYTVDYESCVKASKVYDNLFVASNALELQAEVRAQNSQKEIAQKAQQQALSGDVQGAGLQASKDNSSTMKQINNEKALAYTAAVAALGSTVAKWVDSEKDYCGKDEVCLERIGNVKSKVGENDLFPNKDYKSAFITAIAEYTAKGIAAGIAAGQYKSSEEAVAKIQNKYEEDILDVQLDECVINPTAKKCLGPGTRVAGESFSTGTGNFSIGGADSNSFDLGANSDEFGELGDAANIESQQVAGINSPFEDQVKEANDILDQASAASAGSGDGAAPGGGGGGGGMGGGGSASLGSDTKSPDETSKDPNVGVKKSNVSYASGGAGKGFTGVKSSNEEGNPFASLFDQKGSSGGIEEDRSIASNDIDDKSSVLFKKISKKYSEMHNSKRIEANNLELE